MHWDENNLYDASVDEVVTVNGSVKCFKGSVLPNNEILNDGSGLCMEVDIANSAQDMSDRMGSLKGKELIKPYDPGLKVMKLGHKQSKRPRNAIGQEHSSRIERKKFKLSRLLDEERGFFEHQLTDIQVVEIDGSAEVAMQPCRDQ